MWYSACSKTHCILVLSLACVILLLAVHPLLEGLRQVSSSTGDFWHIPSGSTSSSNWGSKPTPIDVPVVYLCIVGGPVVGSFGMQGLAALGGASLLLFLSVYIQSLLNSTKKPALVPWTFLDLLWTYTL